MADEIDFSAVETPPGDDGGTPPSPDPNAPPKKLAELDAFVPTAEDIDEDFRDKPIKEVLRVAKQHKDEAKKGYDASRQLNDMRSRAETAEKMVAWARQFIPGQQQPQPQQADQFLNDFAAQPQQVLQRAVQQIMQPIAQELEQMRGASYQDRVESARVKAGASLGVDAELWEDLKGPLASIQFANLQNGADPSDPKSWGEAFKSYTKGAARLGTTPGFNLSPPPLGAARSTPNQTRRPQLSARDERNLEELAGMWEIKKGTPAWDKLVKEMAGDPVAMGGMSYE